MSRDCGEVGTTLADLLQRIARTARGLQFTHGLNPAQWEGLRFVAGANRFSRTPSALAAFLGTTKGTASQTLIALENKGYLARRRDPDDRRITYLEPTWAGEALLASDPLRLLDEVAASLPADEATALRCGLERLTRRLAARNGGCEMGVCKACGHFRGPVADSDSVMCGLKQAELPAGEATKLCINFVAGDDSAYA
ncbi:MAG: winged helix-turn-helix transcriptional regulator [Alphaproteobacteria bacterium]|nr:winged helix-turn-helix transcriptional regulator [Alphaproteobacteria bacterium]